MNLVWFRNDLRLEDNVSLNKACDQGDAVIGVYFFDPAFYSKSKWGMNLQVELPFTKTGSYRAQFIIESVTNLRDNLVKQGIPLLVFHAAPHEVLPDLVKKHGIKNIYLQHEWTRDETLQEKKTGRRASKT